MNGSAQLMLFDALTMKPIDELFNILEQGILLATEELRQAGLWKG